MTYELRSSRRAHHSEDMQKHMRLKHCSIPFNSRYRLFAKQTTQVRVGNRHRERRTQLCSHGYLRNDPVWRNSAQTTYWLCRFRNNGVSAFRLHVGAGFLSDPQTAIIVFSEKTLLIRCVVELSAVVFGCTIRLIVSVEECIWFALRDRGLMSNDEEKEEYDYKLSGGVVSQANRGALLIIGILKQLVIRPIVLLHGLILRILTTGKSSAISCKPLISVSK